MSSHVQIGRRFRRPPLESPTLQRVVTTLDARQSRLWSPWIPAMIGTYFRDLSDVLIRVHHMLNEDRLCWLVIGDSKYAGVRVPSARILCELAASLGWNVERSEPFRSMRASAQHGGRDELRETLVVLGKA